MAYEGGFTGTAFDRLRAKARAMRAGEDARFMGEADKYRQAIMAGAGQDISRGLAGVTNQLAGMGPLADSGAATALRSRLFSDVYGRAQGQYADYLRQAMMARQQYRYQMALQKQAAKDAKKGGGGGFFGTLGSLAGAAGGFLVGGPAGAAAGYGAGSNLGRQAPDTYYG